MGMFATFLLEARINEFDDIKQQLLNIVAKKNIIRCYDSYEDILVNDIGCIEITYDAFSVSLNVLSDQAKDFKKSEYGIDFGCSIYINIFHEVSDWEDQLMMFLGYLMKNTDSDCVFEYYGNVTFVRKSGIITVDESRTGRLKKFPYDKLLLNYIEEKITLH